MINLDQNVERYQSPAVKDLVWALLSPTLINSNNANHNPSARWYLEAFRLIEAHLLHLEQDDSPLQSQLSAQPNQRLGIYFERLWRYWLQHNGRYQLLAHSVQVTHEGKTLGEFDFIVHDTAADQIEHWELAVKFYLGIPPLREMHHWFGTNNKDRLDLKYCHLIDKQLTLSETYPGRTALLEQGWPIAQRRLISKGRLYYPLPMSSATNPNLPSCIDPHHLTGCWMSQSAFIHHAMLHPDAGYHWLNKTEWLVRHARTLTNLTDIQQILEQQLHPHPIQLWIEGWQTQPLRLFVVPDDWESAALATLSPQ